MTLAPSGESYADLADEILGDGMGELLPFEPSTSKANGSAAGRNGSSDAEADATANQIRADAQEHIANISTTVVLADVLPSPLAALLNDRAAAFPIDPAALLGPVLAAAASVVGHRCAVQVKRGWSEPLVIWAGNVMQPGTLKTPGASVVAGPLAALQEASFEAHRQAMKGKARDEEDPPPPRRWFVQDVTYERLAEIVAQPNTYGLLCFQDELAAWFAGLDRNGGKARSDWLSLWSGGACFVDRKVAGSSYAPKTAVSLFGNVQPEKLQAMIQGGGDDPTLAGDGLWSRFLWCRPPAEPWQFTPLECCIREEITKRLSALDAMPSGTVLKLTPEAVALAVPYWNTWAKWAADASPARAAFLSKLRGNAVRIAGILHLLTWGEPEIRDRCPPAVPAAAMDRALLLCTFYLAHFDALQTEMGAGEIPADVAAFLRMVKERRVAEVRPRDLLSWKLWGREKRTAPNALQFLRDVAEIYGHGEVVQGSRRDSWIWRERSTAEVLTSAEPRSAGQIDCSARDPGQLLNC